MAIFFILSSGKAFYHLPALVFITVIFRTLDNNI